MVEIAGGDDVLARPREPSFVAAWNQIVAADPAVIVVMPCGFDVPRTRREIRLLTTRPGWDTLRAVRSHRVYLTDASAYFNRPGPRIVDGSRSWRRFCSQMRSRSTCPPVQASRSEHRAGPLRHRACVSNPPSSSGARSNPSVPLP